MTTTEQMVAIARLLRKVAPFCPTTRFADMPDVQASVIAKAEEIEQGVAEDPRGREDARKALLQIEVLRHVYPKATGLSHMVGLAVRDLLKVMGSKRGRVVVWDEDEKIANVAEVHEMLKGFAADPTGDNGTMVVRAVRQALFDAGR